MTALSLTGKGQPKYQVELFCGAEMNFTEMNYHSLYDIYLGLTPGMKWHLGNRWMVAGQVYVPIVNEGYIDRYSMIRLTTATLSKELHFPEARQYLKLSAGLFGRERTGADVKWIFPLNDWLMLTAQAGITSCWALGFKPGGESESEFGKDWKITGTAGASFWIAPLKSEVRISGGRYIDGIYSGEVSVSRHFKYVSFSAFARLHEKVPDRFEDHVRTGAYSAGETHSKSGGFRLIVMLPPYKKSQKKLVVRPASHIQLNYNAQMDEKTMMMYRTDPEANDRTYELDVNWGADKNKGGQ